MSDLRISGFENRNDLREQLDDLADDDRASNDDDEVTAPRAAQIEIAWLRKEIAELQERLLISSGKVKRKEARHLVSASRLAGVMIVVAGFVVGRRLKRI